MNNRGFTLIELITTFSISAVIILLLIGIISSMEKVFSKSNLKTELYVKQSELSKNINSKLNKYGIENYTTCGDSDFCFIFSLKNGENIKLVVEDDKITFGNFVYKLSAKTSVVDPIVTKETIDYYDPNFNDSFLIIKIPIKADIYPNLDFGINLIYQYNSNTENL